MMKQGDRYGRHMALLLAIGVMSAAPHHHAAAEQVIAAGNGQTQTLECDGGEAVLRGNDNQVQFSGRCRALLVEGNSNQVRVQLRGGAPVTVRGNDNAVSYRTDDGESAAVQLAGMSNNVTPEAGAAPVAPSRHAAAAAAASESDDALTLREENARRTIDCAGRAVLVEGNGDDYTFQGGCRSLTVRGEGLRIRAQMQPASQITLQGNGDIVTWSLSTDGPEPATSVDGEGSRITRSSRAADRIVAPVYAAPVYTAPAYAAPVYATPTAKPLAKAPEDDTAATAFIAKPTFQRTPIAEAPAVRPSQRAPSFKGKVIVAGDHEARDIDCTGRDVTINGNFELIVLRGGCRSIAIKGDSNKVQAEIMPGAHISIAGAVNAIAYVPLGGAPGKEAVTSAIGENDHIRRIPALGSVMDTSNR